MADENFFQVETYSNIIYLNVSTQKVGQKQVTTSLKIAQKLHFTVVGY